ncbi:hypothetical protein M9H77_22434 [Catharanthus roseus]|uniref:Uncharacterized protein n=1 Tax=Catharanthus roseus TaxID=4058 RepID=A0ACC0AR73_CATRO|nr:hypothetical protein M9H77_22434 [Catharanthus roseus]
MLNWGIREELRKKALECGPWCFDNNLFILKQWDPTMEAPNSMSAGQNSKGASILIACRGGRCVDTSRGCGNWDHILPSYLTLPLYPSREEKNKQDYELWLSVDAKFHEDPELLLIVKLDDSGKILHINHISANNIEKPLSERLVYGVVASRDGLTAIAGD